MGNFLPIIRLFKKRRFKENSVILITGGSEGIGRQLAISYASRNNRCRLMIAARTEQKLKDVVEICRTYGKEANYLVTDVTIEEQCKNLIEHTIKTYGELDVLILNAGMGAHFNFEQLNNLQVFHDLMAVNFFGYLYCTKYALPYLKINQGQIGVVNSISGEIGLPNRTAYCSSKYAVTGFFEALRSELGDKLIAISLICPISVQTDFRNNNCLRINDQTQQTEIENANNETVSPKKDNRMTIIECSDYIIEAIERRVRKVFIPNKAYLAVYLRPIIPDIVDNLAFQFQAKLQTCRY